MKLINKILVFFKAKPTPVVPQMTESEIIQETIDYYSEDITRRGLQGGRCVYNSDSGGHCAVGRCLMSKYHKQGKTLKGNANSVSLLIRVQEVKTLDDLLDEKYRGHHINFWEMLQQFHDGSKYWKLSGVTKDGEVFLKTNFNFDLIPKSNDSAN